MSYYNKTTSESSGIVE